MNSEEKITIAFLFKRSGKEELSYSDLYLTLSMDLNWFTPEEAKSFIDSMIKKNLITKKDDLIKPNFDINKITVPLGFQPSKRPLEKKETKATKEEVDPTKALVKRIVEISNIEEKEIIKKIKEMEKEKNITFEVAALLVGKEYNVPLDEFLKEIEEKIGF